MRFNIILLILSFFISSCNNGQSQQIKPQKVYRIVYESRPNEWYQKQSELWRAEIDKNPNNPEAWYNYYNANRYANFENIESNEKKEKLNNIIEEMGKAIPGTYEFYLLKYWNHWDMGDMNLVKKAYEINPDRPDTYYPFISEAVINGNKPQLEEFCEKLYKSKDIAPWLINYNYNVLMSVEKNAILITNGDNDTYPIWVLQNVKNIRKDVTVLNISMSPMESYFKNSMKQKSIKIEYDSIKKKAKSKMSEGYYNFAGAFIQGVVEEISSKYPDVPIYFALTVYESFFKPFKKDLYVAGLANRYSKAGIDNIAMTKKIFENRLRLDYLKDDWYAEEYPGEGIMHLMHTNYVLPLVILAEHYKKSGEGDKVIKYKELALSLAKKANKPKLIEYIQKKDL